MARPAVIHAIVDTTSSGKIKSVAITTEDGLIFELRGTGNRNKGFKVDTDDAHYSGSVSLIMMAHSRDEIVHVRHSSLGQVIFGGTAAGASRQKTHIAKAVGLGADPELGGTT